jgi:predicted MPP superfamily phosphohydrolase
MVLVGLLGAGVGIALGAHVRSPVGPFDATLSLRPSLSGGTVVQVAPLGRIRLATHSGPLSLRARLDELRPSEATAIVRNPEVLRGIEDEIGDDVRDGLRTLVLKAIFFGLLGAAATTFLVMRRPKAVGVGLLAGLVGMLATGGLAALTWSATSIAEPQYTGLLSKAPAAIGDARQILSRFSEYRAQLSGLVLNVSRLYETASSLPIRQPDEDVIRVLHVSDIHLNPAAYDLIEQLIEQFQVDVVVDTGDLADWGTPFESDLTKRIGPLGVPYVFVRGNHDSAGTARAVAAQGNAIVLDGTTHTVAGVRFFGMADPRFTPDKRESDDPEAQAATIKAFSEVLDERMRVDPDKPQVLLIHDPASAELAIANERVPLVLAGHTHQFKEQRVGLTTVFVLGSTGGAGLRGLQTEKPTPLSAAVLYLDKKTGRLAAYDEVSVGGLGQESVQISRHVVEVPDQPTPGARAARRAARG